MKNMEIEKYMKKLKAKSVSMVSFWVVVTMGFYEPIWFLMNKKAFNALDSKEKLTIWVFILIMFLYICSFLVGVLIQFTFSDILQVYKSMTLKDLKNTVNLFLYISNTVTLISCVMIFIQRYKVKNILTDHLSKLLVEKVEFSDISMFVFGNIYLQYKINHLLAEGKLYLNAEGKLNE